MAKTARSSHWHDVGNTSSRACFSKAKGDNRSSDELTRRARAPKEINPRGIAQQVKLLLKDLAAAPRIALLAVYRPGGILRIIEQPNTPVELLRSALRSQRPAVMNQGIAKISCLDCEPVQAVGLRGDRRMAAGDGPARARQLLVCGCLRGVYVF